MENCIFCKIAAGEIPCHKVYEDENSLAFLDVKPHAKGHTVIIPKQHAKFICDLGDEASKRLMITVKEVVKILREKLNCDGFNVGWNSGSAAGQVVPHLHIHVMPRYNGDGGGSMHSIVNNSQLPVEEVASIFK